MKIAPKFPMRKLSLDLFNNSMKQNLQALAFWGVDS